MAKSKSAVKRGLSGRGRWITLEVAQENSCGKEEWWKIPGADGKRVEVKQYFPHAPKDKPVFCDWDGDMFLGEWSKKRLPHGFGIFCFNGNNIFKGLVNVGNFEDDECHGLGKEVWLENAPSWKTDTLDCSAIQQPADTPSGFAGRPFMYTGMYRKGKQHGSDATVSLRDGTTRQGAWKNSYPVGDWWKDHQSVAAGAKQEHLDTEDPNLQAKKAAPKPASLKASRRSDDAVAKAPAKKARTLKSAPKPPTDVTAVANAASGTGKAVAAALRRGSSKKQRPDEKAALKAARRSDDGTGAASAKKARTLKSAPGKVKKEPETASGIGKAAAAVRGRGSRKKQRPLDDGSDEQADAVVSSASAAAAEEDDDDDDGAANPDPAKRVKGICKWLARVIGHNAFLAEMEAYAHIFVDRGFHSVGMIRAYCRAEHLDFMRLGHKLSFLDNFAKLEDA